MRPQTWWRVEAAIFLVAQLTYAMGLKSPMMVVLVGSGMSRVALRLTVAADLSPMCLVAHCCMMFIFACVGITLTDQLLHARGVCLGAGVWHY